jgi:hypothetical protein
MVERSGARAISVSQRAPDLLQSQLGALAESFSDHHFLPVFTVAVRAVERDSLSRPLRGHRVHHGARCPREAYTRSSEQPVRTSLLLRFKTVTNVTV